MLLKTHLAFAILLILIFLQQVQSKFIFIIMILISTIIPDLDFNNSRFGKYLIFKPLQIFVKHRGIIHSFSFAIFAAFILAVFWPISCFGFFVGYSAHLICDSFTKKGIQPFWPLKFKSSGILKTGGRIEEGIFIGLIIVNVILVISFFIF